MRASSLHDPHALLQQGDEGQEERSVQAAFVEPLRLHVGGRDHHDAFGEQSREQAPEDHGVGDVGDGELVEAEHPGLVRRAMPRRARSDRRP